MRPLLVVLRTVDASVVVGREVELDVELRVVVLAGVVVSAFVVFASREAAGRPADLSVPDLPAGDLSEDADEDDVVAVDRVTSAGPEPTVDFLTGAFGAGASEPLEPELDDAVPAPDFDEDDEPPDDFESPLADLEPGRSGRDEDADLSEDFPAEPVFSGFPASPAFFGSLVRDLNLPESAHSASETPVRNKFAVRKRHKL